MNALEPPARIAVASLAAGLLSAVCGAPWAWAVAHGAVAGEAAGVWLALLGLVPAFASWAAAGAWAVGQRGRSAVFAGAGAGGGAASLAAAASWLPAFEVWSLDALWRATASADPDSDLTSILSESMDGLVRDGSVAWWAFVACGAAAGGAGAAMRRCSHRTPSEAPLVWPVLLAWVVFVSGLVQIAALNSLSTSGLELRMVGVCNAGLGGALAAGPFVAAAVAHFRSGNWAHRVLAALYGLAGTFSVAVWFVVLLDQSAWESVVGLSLTVAGALAGGVVGVRLPIPGRPRWSSLLGEVLAFQVAATGYLFGGAGAVTTGLTAAILPVAWIPALSGSAPFPSVGPALTSLAEVQLGYLAMTLLVSPFAPLLGGAVVIAALRWARPVS